MLLMITGSVVRVPSVAGIVLSVAGIVLSVAGIVLSVGIVLNAVSVAFFDRIAYEEALLSDTYTGYEDYRCRARWKLLPGLR